MLLLQGVALPEGVDDLLNKIGPARKLVREQVFAVCDAADRGNQFCRFGDL